MPEAITQLSVGELLGGPERYLIPMYQRNYAWEEGEITQLLQDVLDGLLDRDRATRNYYLGSLVVDRRDGHGPALFETLDGQQRLTTLSLLALYLNKRLPGTLDWPAAAKIEFENRPRSTATLQAIAGAALPDDGSEGLAAEQINSGILAGYRLIRDLLPRLVEDQVPLSDFASFLFERVQIMRVEVPVNTDLNHYFEVMNNRGEQLEKHEVLKARLLEKFKHDEQAQACLHRIWEACSNMEKYVQMGFTPAQRRALFDHVEGRLTAVDFQAVGDVLARTASAAEVPGQGDALALSAILEMPTCVAGGRVAEDDAGDDAAPERFSSVINFPNFLLQVLQVHLGENGVRLTLDDKQLLPAFDQHVLSGEHAAERVKAFAFALLRCKLLYDHGVIKREFHNATDGWSLKRFKYTDKGAISYVASFGGEDEEAGVNRSLLMLQSALHVSAPSQVYKYWLTAALRYLYRNVAVTAGDYLTYLQSVARSFVFDRGLALEQERLAYYDLIYTSGERQRVADGGLAARLRYGNIDNNLVFNWLDYLLWEQYKDGKDSKIKEFVFTFRSSVEHYYPQNPMLDHPRLSKKAVDAFGNLCLISHSKNSRLSNYLPDAKKQHYRGQTIDSIKQHLMMEHPEAVEGWGEESIRTHEAEMLEVLEEGLSRSS